MLAKILTPPPLTKWRIRLAFALAVAADAAQLGLSAAGWLGLDEAIDVVLAVAMLPILGFHPLLLPTFLVEFFPVIDMLPTWTGCVALVVAQRKKPKKGKDQAGTGPESEPSGQPNPLTSGD
jgi:hypothetical protein